jgi:hypothetical protein
MLQKYSHSFYSSDAHRGMVIALTTFSKRQKKLCANAAGMKGVFKTVAK